MIRTLALSLLLLTLVFQATAQVYSPSNTTSTPASSNNDSAPSSPTKTKQSPFGQEIPLLNPGDETITIGGLSIPLGDNRVIKARFEKYLNQPAESNAQAKEYHAVLDQITGLLAPRSGSTASRQMKVEEPFALLPVAVSYLGDAKICEALAETVYASLQAKKDVKQMGRLNDALIKKREEIGKQADWELRHADTPGLSSANSKQGSKEAEKKKAKGV